MFSVDNVTLTIEPADTIMEGGMFQVCTDTSDFDGNITFTYSISPSTGLNMGELVWSTLHVEDC